MKGFSWAVDVAAAVTDMPLPLLAILSEKKKLVDSASNDRVAGNISFLNHIVDGQKLSACVNVLCAEVGS